MKSRKKRRKKPFRFLFISILLLLGIYFGTTFIGQIYKSVQIAELKQAEKDKIALLNEEALALREQYSRRESMEFVEQIARDRLGMVKPNEQIVIDETKK